MNEWINVENRLPPHNRKDVLAIYEDGGIFNGRLCYGMHDPFWTDNSKDNPSDTIAKRKVTHWMPLPEPPDIK